VYVLWDKCVYTRRLEGKASGNLVTNIFVFIRSSRVRFERTVHTHIHTDIRFVE